ncbi:MAG TPA: fatty acid hydroxylase, partial [Chitinophagales bacterium]|nr:fatty acid hydroxylase [Chitinophagales bacterium]
MNVKAKNKGNMVFFNSPVLELLTRSHPLLIWGIFLPTSIYMLYAGYTDHGLSVVWSLAMFAAG